MTVTDSPKAIWDTVLQDFRGKPSGYVFVALTPKLSYEEFLRDPDLNKNWERAARNNVVQIISSIHRDCGPSTPFWVRAQGSQGTQLVVPNTPDDDLEAQQALLEVLMHRTALLFHGTIYGEKLVQRVRSLPHVDDLDERVAALVDPAASQAYYMSRQVAFSATFKTSEYICVPLSFLIIC